MRKPSAGATITVATIVAAESKMALPLPTAIQERAPLPIHQPTAYIRLARSNGDMHGQERDVSHRGAGLGFLPFYPGLHVP